jgi:F-type H+-transporting ATPase subunit a
MALPHIPTISADTLVYFGPVIITNTMVNTWLALIIFLLFGLILRPRLALRPGKLQNVAEFFLETLLGYFDQVTGDRKKTLRFLPIAGSVFFFILLSNWLGLMPGTGSITFGHAPLFRPANTDLNLTVIMALFAVISSHFMAFVSIGFFTHLNKFIQLGSIVKSIKNGPIAIFTALVNFVIGLIELVGEASKVLSLSLRLFGNIFAGEVLISVIGALAGLLAPTPFMFLELLVGLIQASVFAILTLVYLTVASEAPHEVDSHH